MSTVFRMAQWCNYALHVTSGADQPAITEQWPKSPLIGLKQVLKCTTTQIETGVELYIEA